MKPTNYLFHTAKCAWEAKSDYACVVVTGMEVGRGTNVMELLDNAVPGATLYTFCEPSTTVLLRAKEVGISAAYYVLPQRDVARLIVAGYDFQLPRVFGEPDVPTKWWPYLRTEALKMWINTPTKTRRPHEQTETHWLRQVAAQAYISKSNYAMVVRDTEVLAQGSNLRKVLSYSFRGATLYVFSEPNFDELLLASAAGIVAVYIAVSKHDLVRHGLVPREMQPKTSQRARKIILTEIVETWNK